MVVLAVLYWQRLTSFTGRATENGAHPCCPMDTWRVRVSHRLVRTWLQYSIKFQGRGFATVLQIVCYQRDAGWRLYMKVTGFGTMLGV